MTILQSILLGVLQGITEFLPISSSGHLVLLQNFFGIKEGNLFFTEMLHFGTLFSIIIVYFNDIINIIVEFFKMIGEGFKTKKMKTIKQLGLLILGAMAFSTSFAQMSDSKMVGGAEMYPTKNIIENAGTRKVDNSHNVGTGTSFNKDFLRSFPQKKEKEED